MIRRQSFTPMRYLLFSLSSLILIGQPSGRQTPVDMDVAALYLAIGLDKYMSMSTFECAITGYQKLPGLEKPHLLVIIDYSKPSTVRRFSVIDLHQKKIRYHTWVAHGRNTGDLVAKHFSNEPDSRQSSLGFFQTAETYYGKHGYSLKLDGLEKGINHHARQRAIVIHGADYVSEAFAKKQGRMGRSWGCPALPTDQSQAIIDLIKGGACVFAYADHPAYLASSTLLR